MLICFEPSDVTRGELDELVGQYGYRDYAAALTTSVGTLLSLQRQVRAEGTLIIEDGDVGEVGEVGVRSAAGQAKVDRAEISRDLLDPPPNQEGISTMPIVIHPVEVPADLSRWLWGQFNKLLPIKLACRALLALQARDSEGVLLDDASGAIAEAAQVFAEHLRQHDELYDLDRDHSLALGFPAPGTSPKAEKSLKRFSDQFVGYADKDGGFHGFLADWQLAAVSPEGWLELTDAGLEFALLKNPAIDFEWEEPADKLSDIEVEMLLEHVDSNVPADASAFRFVLSAIEQGSTSPGDLDDYLSKAMVAAGCDAPITTFVTTQRTGVVSRMLDLALVTRMRSGATVNYEVTAAGRDHLAHV